MVDINVKPIFHESWWLDATAKVGNWGEAIVEKGGEVHARLPYQIKKKYGFTILKQPPLTPFLGPWFKDIPGSKYSKKLAREKDLTEALINKLPNYDYFLQNFSSEIINWLPWHWNGFKQTTCYTYRLNDLSNIDTVWDSMESKIRTDIRKAEKHDIKSVETDDVDMFWCVLEKTFLRQGKKVPYSLDFLKKLDLAAKEREVRKILLAQDSKGRVHAGCYMVWNAECVWYLIGGGDPKLRSSGATSLVLWDAIKFAASEGKIFDFEGSMIEPIERFFRGFGAKQVPYSTISKVNSKILKIGYPFLPN